MNTISKYATYLSSAIFGSTLIFIFMADMSKGVKWVIALSLFIVWFFPLVRIGYLSGKNVEKPNKK